MTAERHPDNVVEPAEDSHLRHIDPEMGCLCDCGRCSANGKCACPDCPSANCEGHPPHLVKPGRPLDDFAVRESGGDIQISCPTCGTFFEMPDGVALGLMVKGATEHDCTEGDDLDA